MKVGIVTLFDNNNFGNKLQNYALQEILLLYADDVVTLKNKQTPKNLKEKISRTTFLAESVFVNRVIGKRRKAAILRFANRHIKLSHKCYFFDKKYDFMPENCDLYCAGSDQIWNPTLGRINGFNYLDFSKKDRNFSFSASFGVAQIVEKDFSSVMEGLQNIRYISVREDAGMQIVQEISDRNDVELIIDPTLYWDTLFWDKVIKRPRKYHNEKYMLTYFLGSITDLRKDELERFAIKHKMKIIDIMDQKSLFYTIGPDEFLYLIKNACIVCTDSFHASVFAFIYDIPLAIFERKGNAENMGSRLESLGEMFQLNKCFVVEEQLRDEFLIVDYSKGKKRLEQERRKVDAFLNRVFIKKEDAEGST